MGIRGVLFGLAFVLGLSVYGSGRTCLVATFQQEVGTKELTGHNDGVRVETYLKSVKLGKGYAWCAAFVNWCFRTCALKGANSALAGAWFPKERIIYARSSRSNPTMPLPGDVCGFIWTGSQIQHIEFVYDWRQDVVKTVGGNTSAETNGIKSRDGDGVWGKRRMRRTVAVAARWIE